MGHKYKRKDSNHRGIQNQLNQLPGISTIDISAFGKGVGDLLLGYKGRNYLFEIKDGSLYPSQKKLTKDEAEFHRVHQGQIDVVETLEEILRIIKYPIIKEVN